MIIHINNSIKGRWPIVVPPANAGTICPIATPSNPIDPNTYEIKRYIMPPSFPSSFPNASLAYRYDR